MEYDRDILVVEDERKSLSHRQCHLLQQAKNESCDFRNVFESQIYSKLDIARFRSSVHAVVAKFDILRSYYPKVEDGVFLYAKVKEEYEPAYEFVDLIDKDEDSKRTILDQTQELLWNLPFSIDTSPFVKFILVRLEEEHFLFFGMTPSVSLDTLSVHRLFEEIERVYLSEILLTEGESDVPYFDIVSLIDEYRVEEEGGDSPGAKFWREYLNEYPSSMVLPVERRLDSVVSRSWKLFSLTSILDLDSKLKVAGSLEHRYLEKLILSGTIAWLSRVSGLKEIGIGVILSGRSMGELNPVLGPFETRLPLEASVDVDTSFDQLACEALANLDRLRDWQDWFKSDLSGVKNPWDVCIEFLEAPDSTSSKGSALFRSIECLSDVWNHALTFSCSLNGTNPSINIKYDSSLFEERMIRRIASQFARAIEEAMRQPDQVVSQSSFLSEVEWVKASESMSLRALPDQNFAFIHDLISAQAEETPDALCMVQGDFSGSYGLLERLSNRLASQLVRDVGVRPDSLVGVRLGSSWQSLVAILGILKSGAAYVPLGLDWPDERVKSIANDAKFSALVQEGSQSEVLPDIPSIDVALFKDDEWQNGYRSFTRPALDPENLVYVLYTSGTSGTPKGVMITHSGVSNYLRWASDYYHVGTSRGSIVHSPLAFDFTLTCLFTPLLSGRCTHFSRIDHPLEGLAEWIQRLDEVSIIKLTPTAVEPLVRLMEAESGRCRIRNIVLGGEALWGNAALWRLAQECEAAIVNEYGPTETVVGSSVYRIDSGNTRDGLIPIGIPISNTSMVVLNDRQTIAETWVEGEVWIGGAGLARGYLNKPAITAASFSPSPMNGVRGARAYRTGDRSYYMEDGGILYLSRMDRQVKVRGHRVELTEVERVLRKCLPVVECVVALVEQTESHPQLVAFLVPSKESEIDLSIVRQILGVHLPDYMIPSTFHLVEELPFTVNGKLDLEKLLESKRARSHGAKNGIAPRTETERTLADLWKKVLNLESVGISDNFFELGGDSILSIQILARANQLGMKLSPRDMQNHPNILELAEVVDRGKSNLEIEHFEDFEAIHLSPIQKRFFDWDLEEPNHFNQSALFKIRQKRAVTDYSRAFNALAKSHDAFRSCFDKVEGKWRPRLVETSELGDIVEHIELGRQSEEELQQSFARAAHNLQGAFDLSVAPLIRALVFTETGSEFQYLYIVAHHLVIDHVSWRVLMEDLQCALVQIDENREIEISSPSLTFGGWTNGLVEYSQQNKFEKEKSYWRSSRWSKVSPIPVDGDRSMNLVAFEDTVSFSIDENLTRRLVHVAAPLYGIRTLDLLISAYALAYYDWSGKRIFSLDMESHGRKETFGMDISKSIGWFTNLYPVLVSLSNANDISASIIDVKEALRRVPMEGACYGLLQEPYSKESPEACRAGESSDVVFNFLGDLGQALDVDSQFKLIRKTLAPNRSSANRRAHLLEIGSYIEDGKLTLNFTYSNRVHHRDSISTFAKSFEGSLKKIASHGSSLESRKFTPSDFSHILLEQEALDSIVEKYPNIEDLYPLSHTQKGILFHSIRGDADGSYLVQLCSLLRGDLDESIFEQSWRSVVERHDVLRTIFLWKAMMEPIQVVLKDSSFSFTRADWREFGLGECERRLKSWLEEERKQEIDFELEPIVRFALFRISDNACYFVWTFHHILLDGWSTSNLLREVLSAYETLAKSKDHEQIPARRYSDYIDWLAQQDYSQAKRYWSESMAGIEQGTSMDVGRRITNPSDRALAHCETMIEVSGKPLEALQQKAISLQTTLNTVLQAAWGLVLSRYCKRSDLVFGVTVAGRPFDLPEVESRVGLFINTLPLRVRVDLGATLESYLSEVGESIRGLLENDFYPLYEILDTVEVPDGTELFESIVVFENYPRQFDFELLRGELEVAQMWSSEQTNYPLTLVVGVREDCISLKLVFDTSRFDEALAGRILQHLKQTLHWMADSGADRLRAFASSWSVTPQTPVELAQSSKAIEEVDTLASVIEKHARLRPSAIAVVDNGSQVSYGELNTRANQLARHLVDNGLGQGDFVALCLDRSPEMIVAILAVLKAGAAYIPIDARFPAQRIRLIAQKAGIAIVDESSYDALCETELQLLRIDKDSERIFRGEKSNLPAGYACAEQVAYLMYTSGSSGIPKGVYVSHRNVLRLFTTACELYDFSDTGNSVWSFFHSISFDFSVWEIFGALLTGGKLVITPHWVARTPSEFAELIRREGVTSLSQTPSYFNQLLDLGGLTEEGREPLALQWVVFGGEAFRMGPITPYREKLASLGIRLINMYGITETTVHVTHRVMDDLEVGDDRSLIGTALPDLSMYLMDEYMEKVPDAIAGEIFVGGEGVALGYADDPRLSAQRFVPDPFSTDPGARLYRSGDLGRSVGESDVEYIGRGDNQVKLRGYRIELGEISQVLGRCPGVRDCLARVAVDRTGDKALLAYVIAVDGEAVRERARAWLSERLPAHMMPTAFFVLERFPLTSNGKLDVSSLPELTSGLQREGRRFARSQNWEQEVISEVWRETLGLNDISLDDDFFAIGGDSIKALRIVAQLKGLGFDTSIADLFSNPSVRALTEQVQSPTSPIGDGDNEEEDCLEFDLALCGSPSRAVDVFPVTQMQLGMLYHSFRPGESSAAYHNVSAFKIAGRFDEVRFRQAVSRLIEKHPVLRSSFDLETFDLPVQVIHEYVESPTSITRHYDIAENDRDRFLKQWIDSEKRSYFEITIAPLVRFKVIVFSEELFCLGVTEHHAILDGWSMASLLTELFGLYACERHFDGGEDERSLILRRYSQMERAALQCERHRNFWADYFRDYHPIEFPVSRTVGDGDSERKSVEKARITIDRTLSDRVRALSNASHVPLKSVLLAAHVRVLATLSNSKDVITGLVSNGRPEVEGGEEGLGLFLNTLPFRMRLAESRWSEFVKAIFSEEKKIMPYRRFPLAAMADDFGENPVVNSAFNYVNFHVYDNLVENTGLNVLETIVHEETNFDLLTDFSVLSGSGELDLTLSYSALKFDEARIKEILAAYVLCLECFVEDEDSSLALAIFGETIDSETVADASDLAGEDRHYDFDHIVRGLSNKETWHHIAVIDGDRHVSYGALCKRVFELSNYLAQIGIEADDVVAVMLPKSVDWIVSMIAVFQSGGVYLPIDPFDPLQRIEGILRDSGSKALVTTENRLKLIDGTPAQVIAVDTMKDWFMIDRSVGRVNAHGDNLAYLIYTSGTTGTPKGVGVSRRSIANLIDWQTNNMPLRGLRITQFASTGFDVSVQEILTLIAEKGTLVVVDEETRKDFVALVALAERMRVECIFAPFTAIKAIVTASLATETRLEALRVIVNAGEALLLDNETSAFLTHCFGCSLYNQYGPTETHVVSSCEVDTQSGSRSNQPSIGWPVLNTCIEVLDPWLNEMPVGVVGDIYLSSIGVARGYHSNPSLTAERFIPRDVDCIGSRRYKSGDIGYRDGGGKLHYVGRSDSQVKLRGYRIEIDEVRRALLQHPFVDEGAITLVGERGKEILRAIVSTSQNLELTELRSWLAKTLPRYMLPGELVVVSELPLTKNGKIDLVALSRMNPKPSEALSFEEAQGVVESRLADIWREVLGRDAKIALHHDFVDLGGSSLSLLKLQLRINSEFEVKLTIGSLAGVSVFEDMVGIIKENLDTESSNILDTKLPI